MQIKEQLLDIEGIKNSKASLLDLFIRRTAVLTSTPEHLVEKIIKDQWANANKMTQQGKDISEFDFPNIGMLYVSPTKTKRRIKRVEKLIEMMIERLKTKELDAKEANKSLTKIQHYKEFINSMKQKTKIKIEIQDEV